MEARGGKPYRMRLIIQAMESDHTIQARKGGTSTTAAMGVQLFLRQDIPATLRDHVVSATLSMNNKSICTWEILKPTSH